jgi:hypothetical protein
VLASEGVTTDGSDNATDADGKMTPLRYWRMSACGVWPGVDVTITIFCDFRQFSPNLGEKIGERERGMCLYARVGELHLNQRPKYVDKN